MPESAGSEAHAVDWAELHRFASHRLGDTVHAADIVQEAYLRLTETAHEAAILDRRAYLFATVRNLVADHWRRDKARLHAPLDTLPPDKAHDLTPSPEQRLLSIEELAVLERAVLGLPPRTREVFRLHKYEHLSYADVAERLGMAKNTVMVHMVKALSHCRTALQEYRCCEKAVISERA